MQATPPACSRNTSGLIWYLPLFLLHQNIISLFHFFFTINVSQIIFPLVLYTFVLSKYKIKRSCPMDCQIWSFRRGLVGTLEHPKSRSVSPSLIEPTSVSSVTLDPEYTSMCPCRHRPVHSWNTRECTLH